MGSEKAEEHLFTVYITLTHHSDISTCWSLDCSPSEVENWLNSDNTFNNTMPGNEKKGADDGQDPDPTPYLFLTFQMKREDMTKAYDAKKSYWVPDGDGGFVEAMLESENGGKVQVSIGHDKKVFKKEQIQQVNPPKFEKCEDMSNLTYLNEASVLHNLRSRYQAKLIYVRFFLKFFKSKLILWFQTYSGLFCVAVNPYKRYPIYTKTAVKLYLGKRRTEVQ